MSGNQSEDVRKEVDRLLANIKQTSEDQKREWEELKNHDLPKLIKQEAENAVDPLLDAKVKAATEGVLTKQEALDEHLQRLETAIKRAPLGGEAKDKEEFEAAKAFQTHCAVRYKRLEPGRGIKDEDVDVEAYRAYKQAHDRYIRRDEKGMDVDELKALTVGSDPEGGYVVMPERSSRIITRIYETSPVRTVATVENISTDALDLLVDKDQADYGWVAETSSRPQTGTPNLAKQTIPAYEMYAQPAATQTLLDDAAVDMEAWLDGKVADRFSRAENEAFIKGDGQGKPQGMITLPAGTSWGQVEQVNSKASASITKDGVIDAFMALKEVYMTRSSWLLHRKLVAEIMKISSTTDVLLWMPSLRDGMPQTLIGRPLRFAQDLPEPAADSLSGLVGDFAEAYTIVDRIGIRTLRDPYTAKPYVLFYTTKRTGGAVVNSEAYKVIKLAA